MLYFFPDMKHCLMIGDVLKSEVSVKWIYLLSTIGWQMNYGTLSMRLDVCSLLLLGSREWLIGRRLSWPLTILAPYILYTKGRHRGAYPLSHCIKLLCNFRVSVKVNHSTLVYIVYYNVKLLALIIYKCINYITLNTSYIFIL